MGIWFSNPLYLWLLVPIPIFLAFMFLSIKRGKSEIEKIISFHALEFFFEKGSFASSYIKRNFLIFAFRALIYLVFVLVISGAVVYYSGQAAKQAVVIAVDSSGSMLAEDIEPNRLEAVKETLSSFLEKIPEKSSVAVLSFSGNAYIEQYLSKKEDAIESIKNIRISEISGTSIGTALKTASDILSREDAPKLVLLISDGGENILSEQALGEVMKNLNTEHITVDVIGIGKLKSAKLPGQELSSELNEPLLESMAKDTGGIYIRADSKRSLSEAYGALASSTKLKIPLILPFHLAILSIILLLVDYLFIRVP